MPFGPRSDLLFSLKNFIKLDDSPEEMYRLGLSLMYGIGIDFDFSKGIALISKAAEDKYLPAMLQMAQLYKESVNDQYVKSKKGVETAYNIYVDIIENFSDSENKAAYSQALYKLGRMYVDHDVRYLDKYSSVSKVSDKSLKKTGLDYIYRAAEYKGNDDAREYLLSISLHDDAVDMMRRAPAEIEMLEDLIVGSHTLYNNYKRQFSEADDYQFFVSHHMHHAHFQGHEMASYDVATEIFKGKYCEQLYDLSYVLFDRLGSVGYKDSLYYKALHELNGYGTSKNTDAALFSLVSYTDKAKSLYNRRDVIHALEYLAYFYSTQSSEDKKVNIDKCLIEASKLLEKRYTVSENCIEDSLVADFITEWLKSTVQQARNQIKCKDKTGLPYDGDADFLNLFVHTYVKELAFRDRPYAYYMMGGVLYSADEHELAFECYKKAMLLESPLGYFGMALLYTAGKGVEKNTELGRQYLQKSLNSGDDLVTILAALDYLNGTHFKKDINEAIRLLERLSETKCLYQAEAASVLGDIFLEKDDPDSEIKAFEYKQKAASLGWLSAKRDLALMYFKGSGVKEDKNKGFEMLKSAYLQGDLGAGMHLGNIYTDEDSTMTSLPKAVKILQEVYDKARRIPETNKDVLDILRSLIDSIKSNIKKQKKEKKLMR